MTLVERAIEFRSWSASRKTALLSGLAFLFHVFGSLIASYAFAPMPAVDVKLFDAVAWPWVASLALCCLICLAVSRSGREGRWTILLLIIPYLSFMVSLIYIAGMAATALYAWYPLVVLLFALWYGLRVAWLSFVYVLCLTLTILWLQSNGELPFAPFFLDRSLEVQRNGIFVAVVIFVIMLVFAFCFTLVALLLAAQKLQEAKLDRSARLIRRYIPSQLADKIIKGEYSEVFKPERAKLTVFFSDVEGFTQASDHLDPEDLAALLNEYLSEMMAIAEHHGATINQIVGDGIMAFFGAPQVTSDKDHALRAVRMALQMQQRMVELKDVWVDRGIQKPFRIRIGINTGHASVGDYGSPGRKLYSAIGVQTNLAARIQAHCEPGKVLISHSTWALIHDDIACVDKGELQLKGVHYPVRVYEVGNKPA